MFSGVVRVAVGFKNFFDRAIRSVHLVEKVDFLDGMRGSDCSVEKNGIEQALFPLRKNARFDLRSEIDFFDPPIRLHKKWSYLGNCCKLSINHSGHLLCKISLGSKIGSFCAFGLRLHFGTSLYKCRILCAAVFKNKYFTFFVVYGDNTYHVPGTGTRYLRQAAVRSRCPDRTAVRKE